MIPLGTRRIGKGQPACIVAELSGNHNRDFDTAVELIRQSADAGADAVKIQTYTPDTITLDCGSDQFRIGEGGPWAGKRLYDLYAEACTPWEWYPDLKKTAQEAGLPLFSTPFDPTAVDFLEKMDVPAYKIASFEIVDLPLIRKVAATKKPLIISTGMASLEEIDDAVQTARKAGNGNIILLKCTSAYPAPAGEMNLRTIPYLSAHFGLDVGLSDHSNGILAPVVAVSLGACMVEKHITLSRAAGGVDASFSLEPDEFRKMTAAIRKTEQALGRVSFEPSEHELANLAFRRSLYVVEDIRKGDRFTGANIRSIRPGFGLPPRHLDDVLGRTAKKDARRGTPLTWDLID